MRKNATRVPYPGMLPELWSCLCSYKLYGLNKTWNSLKDAGRIDCAAFGQFQVTNFPDFSLNFKPRLGKARQTLSKYTTECNILEHHVLQVIREE